jgi:hypothetical protein
MRLFKLLLISKPSDRDRLRRFGVGVHSKGFSGAEAKDIASGKMAYPAHDPEALNFQTEYIRDGETILVGSNEFTQTEWNRMRDLLAGKHGHGLLYCLWQYDGGWIKTRTDNTSTTTQRPREVLAELGITDKKVH